MSGFDARAVVFDLDGTLTDPRVGIVRSLRHALEGMGRVAPAEDVLASFIGPPLRSVFATLLETGAQDSIEEAMARYRSLYSASGIYETVVYPGVPEMLAALRTGGATLFIATSKPSVFAQRVVDHLELRDFFAAVHGPELEGRYDDKADLLGHLLEVERVRASDAVMVGDRAYDVVAARRNGVRSVGVLWGYGSEAELTEAGADRICRSPREVAAAQLE